MPIAKFQTWTFVCLVSLTGAASPVCAADFRMARAPAAQPIASYDWTGAYLGFHTGYGWGTSNASDVTGGSLGNNDYSGQNSGFHAGHQTALRNGLVYGVEADITFPNYLPSNAVMAYAMDRGGTALEQMDYTWTIRARLGYASGNWLTYVTGGLAGLSERFDVVTPSGADRKDLRDRLGWTAGGGVEYAFAPQWRSRIEYLYSHYDPARVELAPGALTNFSSDYHTVRIGLTRQFGGARANSVEDLFATGSDRWEIHGQSTYLPQAHGRFRAPYSGPNSLSSRPGLPGDMEHRP